MAHVEVRFPFLAEAREITITPAAPSRIGTLQPFLRSRP